MTVTVQSLERLVQAGQMAPAQIMDHVTTGRLVVLSHSRGRPLPVEYVQSCLAIASEMALMHADGYRG